MALKGCKVCAPPGARSCCSVNEPFKQTCDDKLCELAWAGGDHFELLAAKRIHAIEGQLEQIEFDKDEGQ